MIDYKHNLGIALIPNEENIDKIYSLVEDIMVDYHLPFSTNHPNLPHATIFAGRYKNLEAPINILENFSRTKINRNQRVKDLEIWAEKILFLNLVKGKDLQEAHNYFFNRMFPISEGEPADTQVFNGITWGQQMSFDETGYPFSKEEYLPHFTLGHLGKIPEDKMVVKEILNEILKDHSLDKIEFDRLALFKMLPKGACQEIVYEKGLKC